MSDLDTLQPGVPLDPKQKAALASANIQETNEAHRLAAEHRARDVAGGHGEPAVKVVADLLKEKLQREEFDTKKK